MTRRRQNSSAPVVRCHPRTAAFLGAVPLAEGGAQRAGPRETIVVRTSDGGRWLWPVETELRAAILRA